VAFFIATDPNLPSHHVVCGDDYAILDVSGDNSGCNATVSQPSQSLTPPAGGTSFPLGAGGIAFTSSSATLYAVSLSGETATATQSSAQLLSLADNGSSTAWANGDPGNSFGSYISWPTVATLTVASSGTQTLPVGAQPNLAVYATVSD